MATPTLSDLRRAYFGGGSDAEYQALLAAQAAGLTALDLAAGREAAYAEILASFAPGNGNLQDIPGLSITFTPGVRPIEVEFFAQGVANSIASGGVLLSITKSDNTQYATSTCTHGTAATALPGICKARKVFPAGVAITLKARIAMQFGGNVSLTAGATAPAYIRAVEC